MIAIVLWQRGNIDVGELSMRDGYWHLTRASCIRNWGTADTETEKRGGLIGLAQHGPYKETILDGKGGHVFGHELTVVKIIEANAKAWEPYL